MRPPSATRDTQVPEREHMVRSPVCASFGCCGSGYGFGLAGRDDCWPVEVAGADERKTGERAAITLVTEAERTDRERSPGDTVPTAALCTAIRHPSPLPSCFHTRAKGRGGTPAGRPNAAAAGP